MSNSRGFSYGVILAAAFVLWIPVALFGGQGYSSLLALAALPALFFVRFNRFNLLFATVLALTLWAALSSFWSAESSQVVYGDLNSGDFSIGAAGLRMILTALAGGLVTAACLRIRSNPRLAFTWIVLILLIHGGLVLAIGLFPETALALYAPTSDPVNEAPQNILRNANSFLLALPVLLGMLWLLRPPFRDALMAVTFVAAGLAFYLVGSDVALFGLAPIAIAMAVTALFRRNGYRVLLGTIAVAILVSPVVLRSAAPAVINNDISLSASAKSRVFAWSLASEKVMERPITGHGIEASKEWRETFADKPELLALMKESTDISGIKWENYRILPGHPHNMGLQLWAETGLVGVVIACVALLLLALALPPPMLLSAPVNVAASGLIGATFALFSLSYSLWNEAFWANVCLVAAVVILKAKVVRAK